MPDRAESNVVYDAGLMWFRRDLRCHDNAALYQALKACKKVWCVFVFDTDILDPLLDRGLEADRRVEFIRESLVHLNQTLAQWGEDAGRPGVGLIVLHGEAVASITKVATRLGVQAVFCNHDDDPAAKSRDARALGELAHAGILLKGYKDHVIFERREVLTQAGHPYGVFTPYKKAWLNGLTEYQFKAYPCKRYGASLAALPERVDGAWLGAVPRLSDLDFTDSGLASLKVQPGADGATALLSSFMDRIEHYHEARDYPAIKGPSYLGVHLRFGTLSVRQAVAAAYPLHLQGFEGASTWLSELIWRDFYHQILANYPHVVTKAFKPEYDHIRFEHGKHATALFDAWRQGRTGYPLVDAAMAQINQTGYMHNRLRMVVASFLVKDLGLHWRWGEQYFADHLIDFDLASNNGGWQWASSSGCDAQPYFRIFNPVSQSEKFDPHGKFIRRYLPALASLPDNLIHAPWKASEIELEAAGVTLGRDYPKPMVDHTEAREKTLRRYAVVKNPGKTP
ncbi:deoxyribodipyrimidine photo-lyase [Hydrogenophaga sp. 5NK40-0174]|uniref:cryptochrome/photolyase family protein n=1 Tax=Hydrogenophaga sp. 5NK40-0174 TaxID=3127649 RepID=UPI003107773E